MRKKKTKLLVIGGTGFIGHHLIKKTVKLGWIVSSISRKKPSKVRKIKKVKYYLYDLNKLNKFKNPFYNTYDYIVNLSHISGVHQKNKVEKIINFSIEKKIKKFIHIGSSSEYGVSTNKPILESSKCKPISTYGRNKLALTKTLISNYRDKSFPVIILRLFQVYGPNDNNNKVLPYVIRNCIKDKKFKLTAGYQTRDFCYIDDVIKAIILVMKSKKDQLLGQIFNIAYGKSIKIRDLVKIVRKNIKRGVPKFGEKKIKKNEIILSNSSIKKIKKFTSWRPKKNLKDGIKLLIKYEK